MILQKRDDRAWVPQPGRRQAERNGLQGHIIEKQLAHEEGNSVRKVYYRAEYLDERRDMMQQWADYLQKLWL